MASEAEVEVEVEGPVDVVAFPFLAQGHVIPFVRLSEILASKNLRVVLLTSPLNANRLKAKQNAAITTSSSVRVMDIPLPSVAGLPAGAENTEQLTVSQLRTLFAAIEEMEPFFAQLVARLKPKCLIADFCPLFLPAVADELKIPVFFYLTMGAYGLSMMQAFTNSLPLLIPVDGTPAVLLPGLPTPVLFNESDILFPFRGAGRTGFPHDFFSKFFKHIKHSQGVVINTFAEMEGEYLHHVRSSFGLPVWSVGPLLSRPSGDFEGGVKEWLDSRAARSVVYINFGSEIALSREQMEELAAGLEASGHCFLWGVKNPPGGEALHNILLLQGFRERTMDRGLVVTGWAPQQAILSHPSTGGFLSHCGWNSTLESISNGIPILAWPFQHDQPFVKKLLVEDLRVAEEVKREHVENGIFIVTSAEVERTVKLIIEGKEGRDMRRRACELKEAAIQALGEGGSSFTNLQKFVSMIHNIQTK